MGWLSDITNTASSFFSSPDKKAAPEPAPAAPTSAPVPAPTTAPTSTPATTPPAAADVVAAHPQIAGDATDEAMALEMLAKLEEMNGMITLVAQLSTSIDQANTELAKQTAASFAALDDTAPNAGLQFLENFGLDSKQQRMEEHLATLTPEVRSRVIVQMREQGIDDETIAKAENAVESVEYTEERERKNQRAIDGGVDAAEKAAKSGKTGALADSLDKLTPSQREEAMDGMSSEARAAAEKVLEQRRARLVLVAERLEEAVIGGGTDDVAVLTNLSGLSASEADELQEIYAENHTDIFGDPRNLREDLLDDYDDDDDEASLIRAVMRGDTEAVTQLSVDLTVSYLEDETDALINADEEAINELLRAHNRNPEAAQRIADAYYKATGNSLETECADVMNDAESTEMHANLAGDRHTANAAVIEQGDEDRVERVIDDVDAEEGDAGLTTLAKDVQDLTGQKITDIASDAIDVGTTVKLIGAETSVQGERDAKLDAALLELEKDPAALAKANAKAVQLAAQLHTELDGYNVGANTEVTNLLRGLGPAEVRLVMNHYRVGSAGEPRDLEADLREKLDGRDLKVANAALTGDKVLTAVALAQQARDGVGTDVQGWTEALAMLETEEERAAFHAMIDKHEGKTDAHAAMVTSETTSFDRDALNAAAIENEDERVATMAQVKMNRNAYGGTIATWQEGLGDYVGDAIGESPEARAKRRISQRENDWLMQFSNLGGSENAQLDALDSLQNENQVRIMNEKVLAETGMSVADNVESEMSGHHAQAGQLYAEGRFVEAKAERMVAELDNWVDDREDAASKAFENPYIDQETKQRIAAIPAGPERDAALRKAQADARMELLAAADVRAKMAGYEGGYHQMLMSETSESQLLVAEDRIAMGKASDVNALYDAGGTLGFGKNTAEIYRILDERTPAQMEQFGAEFEKAHPGVDFQDWVMSRAKSDGERRDLEIKLKGNYARMSDDELAEVDPVLLLERAEALESAARDGGIVPSVGNWVGNQLTDAAGNTDERLDARMEVIEKLREKIDNGEELTPSDREALIKHTKYMAADSSEFTRDKNATVGVVADGVGVAAEVAATAVGAGEVAGLVGDSVRMNVNGTLNPGRYSQDQMFADHVGLLASAGGTAFGLKNPLGLGKSEKAIVDAGVEGVLGAAGESVGNTQNLNDFGQLVDATGHNMGKKFVASVASALTGGIVGDGVGGRIASNTVDHVASGDDSKSVLEQLGSIGWKTLKGFANQKAGEYHESQRQMLPDGPYQIKTDEDADGPTAEPDRTQASTSADGTGDSLDGSEIDTVPPVRSSDVPPVRSGDTLPPVRSGDTVVPAHAPRDMMPPGFDPHSHFLGVPSPDDFALAIARTQHSGDGDVTPLDNMAMLDALGQAVRTDDSFSAHYDENGDFDFSGARRGERHAEAFENVRAIEQAQRDITALRESGATRQDVDAVAREAVHRAMTSSQDTPFDGSYSIRDALVKKFLDPKEDGRARPYDNTTRMTLDALARDGVEYSEQSQSVNKLTSGAFPEGIVDRANAERVADGQAPVDVRFLAMLHTSFLGPETERTDDAAWDQQLGMVRQALRRGDVMGVDFAAPEVTDMTDGGATRDQRMIDIALELQEAGAEAGRPLVLRPHVGEGYVEMPAGPDGKPAPFDRDDNAEHYDRARDNMTALLDSVDLMVKLGIYDPANPNPQIRFGHATHATPEIAARMRELGIVAEVNLGSNAVSGSLQDDPTSPAGRDANGHLRSFEDHSLLALAGQGTEIILGTDAQSVMGTTLNDEYGRAWDVLSRFRGGDGERPRGKMPVTKEQFEAVKGGGFPPPFELGYDELPESMRQNVDNAYHRMVISAEGRRDQVEVGDANDTRRAK